MTLFWNSLNNDFVHFTILKHQFHLFKCQFYKRKVLTWAANLILKSLSFLRNLFISIIIFGDNLLILIIVLSHNALPLVILLNFKYVLDDVLVFHVASRQASFVVGDLGSDFYLLLFLFFTVTRHRILLKLIYKFKNSIVLFTRWLDNIVLLLILVYHTQTL